MIFFIFHDNYVQLQASNRFSHLNHDKKENLVPQICPLEQPSPT